MKLVIILIAIACVFCQHTLVLVRHGETSYNNDHKYTGWTDVSLNEKGETGAKTAGELLKGQIFKKCFRSILKRTKETLDGILLGMDLTPEALPCEPLWQLNERHYGDYQGEIKPKDMTEHETKFDGEIEEKKLSGDKLVAQNKLLTDNNVADTPAKDVLFEKFQDTVDRIKSVFDTTIKTAILSVDKTIMVLHANTIRCLLYHLAILDKTSFEKCTIKNATPITITFDADFKITTDKKIDNYCQVAAGSQKKKFLKKKK
jgi:2,3-bisphosphoglycerate-dependent phosphoglycerate mutase